MHKQGNLTQDLPIKIREEKARIAEQNALLDKKLTNVRSVIPMNSSERQEQGLLMDNYRRFASKYNAQGPKLDPLVKKKLGHDDNDRSPGRNLFALNNLS